MLIKTTPPELAAPSHDIDDMELNALVNLTDNPGIDEQVFRELAKSVLRDTRGLDYKKQIAHLEYLALRIFTKRETAHIIHKKQLTMDEVALADKPDQSVQYGRGPDDAA